MEGASIVMQIRGGQFRKRMSVPAPWYKKSFNASTFLDDRLNFMKKMKNSIFRTNLTFFRVLSFQNLRMHPNIFHTTKHLMLIYTSNS